MPVFKKSVHLSPDNLVLQHTISHFYVYVPFHSFTTLDLFKKLKHIKRRKNKPNDNFLNWLCLK
jgi:hypothetical protein